MELWDCAVSLPRRDWVLKQIIILGRHSDRIALAKDFGATDVVGERGEAAVERVRELTGGSRRDQLVPECVGLEQAVNTAISIASSRWCSRTRRSSAGTDDSGIRASVFQRCDGRRRAGAGVKRVSQGSMSDVLEGNIDPGRVLDLTVGLDVVIVCVYRAMNDRRKI